MDKQQLEQLSDFEINLAVTISVTGCAPLNKVTGYHSGYAAVDYENENMPNGEGLKYVYIPDYCNNWSDMGPLIDSSQIKMDPRKSLAKLGWMASCGDERYSISKNPLRAAAIVYLLMQEGV